MTTPKKTDEENKEPAEHVHGPDCNHDHEHHHEPVKQIINDGPKVGRNYPCPCGSQKKFKKCCGK